ncbi:hypothetical protein ABGB18_42545 [Nonomuraea sp. B12E4]
MIRRCPHCSTPLDEGPVVYRCGHCRRTVWAADLDTEYRSCQLATTGAGQ